MKNILARRPSRADVALLLEGTFPYVAGGVSSWVADLLQAMPQTTFAIVFIGGQRADYAPPRYKLPDNVVHFQEVFLFDPDHSPPGAAPLRGCPHRVMAQVRALHDEFGLNRGASGARMADLMPAILKGQVSEEMFLHSQSSWDEIQRRYDAFCTDPSFTDYFWTVRTLHAPLWKLMRVARNMVPTRACHVVSTGYAGFLGTMLHLHHKVPLMVTEHGIYTKERQIDLFQSEWLRDNRSLIERNTTQIGYFQDLWVRFFQALGSMAYDSAQIITALYEGNRQRQILDGAEAARTRLIPNGIDLGRYRAVRERRPAGVPRIAALIGRIVPIKDVKTFIRALFIAHQRDPELRGWIVGPEDEDPDYVTECRELIATLGLGRHVRLLGFQDIRDILAQVGVVVLSSISEGLPLVVLEAFTAGVPVVTTDVGACRELVEGRDQPDRALGHAGRIVQIADAPSLATAILQLLQDDDAWHAAQAAAIQRVERYYAQEQMVHAYQTCYEEMYATTTQGHPQAGTPARPHTISIPPEKADAWQA